MQAPRKRTRMTIIQDEVKLAHTNHWDLDYLDRDELEALMKRSGGEAETKSASADRHGNDKSGAKG